MSDEMLGSLFDSSAYMDIRKRLLQAKLKSEADYQRELGVARSQQTAMKMKKKEAR